MTKDVVLDAVERALVTDVATVVWDACGVEDRVTIDIDWDVCDVVGGALVTEVALEDVMEEDWDVCSVVERGWVEMGWVTSLVVVTVTRVGPMVVFGRVVVFACVVVTIDVGRVAVVAMVVTAVRLMRVVVRRVVMGRIVGTVVLVVATKLHELMQKFHTAKQSDWH